MSIKSKRTLTSIITGAIFLVAYAVYALGRDFSSTDLKSWAILLLIFIGISIAAMVLIQILFHLIFAVGTAVKEHEKGDREVERIIEASVVEDEMDALINLKSGHVGSICTGLGFVAALAALALSVPAAIALHIMFGASALGSLIEGGVSIYFYERGV